MTAVEGASDDRVGGDRGSTAVDERDAHVAFRAAYAEHRHAEGRSYSPGDLIALPYLRRGPQAAQWAVRARTFDAFVRRVVEPHSHSLARPLTLLDVGAGNGWLCYRMAMLGHQALAFDVRADRVDGLGAGDAFISSLARPFDRVCGSFDELPLASASFDIAVFNASLHYALDLGAVIGEASRVVRSGGRIAILDSPFYRDDTEGLAMVNEKRAAAERTFGDRAGMLMALPFVEFLTSDRLERASGDDLCWRRHRVLYPIGYETRPIRAMIRGRRRPSRFDLWEGIVP